MDLDPPLQARPPLSIPGTLLSLVGTADVSILGVGTDALRVGIDGGERALPLDPTANHGEEPVRIAGCARVRHAGADIALQPHVFLHEALDLLRTPRSQKLGFQRKLAPLLRASLELVERYAPESFRQVREQIRVVAFRALIAEEATGNVSHSDLPGAVILKAVRNPHHLADALVHELHHHRLFCLEEAEPLLEPGLETRLCYSPWRDEARPVRGLLHAVYVHVPVTRFWLQALAGGDLDASTRALALDRIARGVLQLRMGLHQLRRHAHFTAAGASFFADLEQEVAAVADDVAGAGLPEDPQAADCQGDGAVVPVPGTSVRAELTAHLRKVGRAKEVGEILRDIL